MAGDVAEAVQFVEVGAEIPRGVSVALVCIRAKAAKFGQYFAGAQALEVLFEYGQNQIPHAKWARDGDGFGVV
jgi:hypothetical protein